MSKYMGVALLGLLTRLRFSKTGMFCSWLPALLACDVRCCGSAVTVADALVQGVAGGLDTESAWQQRSPDQSDAHATLSDPRCSHGQGHQTLHVLLLTHVYHNRQPARSVQMCQIPDA
eukprot:366229-Chlamydomonas_euryale.AAC.48